MRDGPIGPDAYLEEWIWSDDAEMPGEAADVADAVVAGHVAHWGQRR
jgi:hypothetical protein